MSDYISNDKGMPQKGCAPNNKPSRHENKNEKPGKQKENSTKHRTDQKLSHALTFKLNKKKSHSNGMTHDSFLCSLRRQALRLYLPAGHVARTPGCNVGPLRQDPLKSKQQLRLLLVYFTLENLWGHTNPIYMQINKIHVEPRVADNKFLSALQQRDHPKGIWAKKAGQKHALSNGYTCGPTRCSDLLCSAFICWLSFSGQPQLRTVKLFL